MSKGGTWSATAGGRSTSPTGPKTSSGTGSMSPRSSTTGRWTRWRLVVLADTMPGAVGEKVGRRDRSWFAPSIDLTVHILDHCRSPWILAHNRARYAGDGYASADMALWDLGPGERDEPRLVVYATQLFLFTFARRPPPDRHDVDP